MIPEHIFRAYDIRGVYGVDLTEEVALKIGRSVSTYLNGKGKDVTVGRDVRLSGGSLEDALIRGLLSGGCDVEEIGMVTTPILYFSSVHHKKDAGIMVTASHNPPEWNGFKIWTKNGFICEGEGMEEIKKIATDGRFKDLT
ncbi:MAG: phosphomannomutase, partial [Candidatus Bathyarchaeia archaeon]